MQVRVNKGYDLPLAGQPAREIHPYQAELVAYRPSDFRYLKLRLKVEEGDTVQKGQVLFVNKADERMVFLSPISAKVEAIQRGARRVIEHIVLRPQAQNPHIFTKLDLTAISKLDSENARSVLLERGFGPALRQRPYDMIANLNETPSSILVTAIDSNPLAADPNFYLDGRADDFRAGLSLLTRLCNKVHVVTDGNGAVSSTFTSSVEGAQVHSFSGVHPRGNVSVHIEKLDPVGIAHKLIWHIRAQEVVALGKTLLSGEYDSERVIAWAGPASKEARYYRTVQGASLKKLPRNEGELRVISGSVLNGLIIKDDEFLAYYDNSVCVLSEDRSRELFGWMAPGLKSHSLTRAFASTLMPKKEYAMGTNIHGGDRAIVDSEMYDKVQALSVPTVFLYKSLLAGDIDEAERLGLWCVAPEDFALASYMCPSKTDFCAVVQDTLDSLHKEG